MLGFLRNFNTIQRHRYNEYLKGKSVAIVGPAAYLKKFNFGEKIDSFDCVVRLNRGLEVIESLSQSVGRKSDILYNCLIERPDNGGELNVDFFKANHIDWICTIPNSTKEGLSKSMDLHPDVRPSNVKKLKKNFNFRIMDYKIYNKVNSKIECRSNTGFAAIFDLLSFDIKSLFITGFSFYLDDFIEGYKNGCDRDEKSFALDCFNSERHKQKPQWEYLKKIYKKSENITADSILEEILELDELSRSNFRHNR